MLVVSTNLDPDKVMNPAFLRRMGYRLSMGAPSREAYARILRRVAAERGLSIQENLTDEMMDWYAAEGRDRQACHPRDLLGRLHDIARLRNRPFEADSELMRSAWDSYFGARTEPMD